MAARLMGLPLIVLVMAIGAAAMMVPAVHAAVLRDFEVMRAFFYAGLLFLILTLMIAVATNGRVIRRQARSQLLTLLGTFTVMPVMLAVPFHEAVGNTSFLNAYVEMVSSLTTTGATLYAPERLSISLHLWRAQVGWMGGFFVWVTAAAILAPLNLGGFEVRSNNEIGQGAAGLTQITRVANPGERLARFAWRLFPVYFLLTLVLWMVLLVAGDTPTVALCHAMSTLATSAISPLGGLDEASSGLLGEVMIALFLVFSLSRVTYSRDEGSGGLRVLAGDPELRLGLLLVAIIPVALFLRHWLGAFDVAEAANLEEGLRALWGGIFMVMSFLTTTGFESASWDEARTWSGLEAPGLILMGLALFGGGVATTAGGVKLLRVYALYKHGARELEKLVYPSSVAGSGQLARQIRRQGAYVSWIFFMLFAMSIAVISSGFALTGLGFEAAITLTLAALTTTGPLISVAAPHPIALDLLEPAARLLFAAAMVLGRLETLAIIALLNPDFWRR